MMENKGINNLIIISKPVPTPQKPSNILIIKTLNKHLGSQTQITLGTEERVGVGGGNTAVSGACPLREIERSTGLILIQFRVQEEENVTAEHVWFDVVVS